MNPSSATFYVVGFLFASAVLAAAVAHSRRLSLYLSVFAFGTAELALGWLAAGRVGNWLPPVDSRFLTLSGYRLDAASLLLLFCAASYLLVHAFAEDEVKRGSLGPLFLLAAAAGILCAASENLLVTCFGLELGALAAHGITAFPSLTRDRFEALWKQYAFHGLGTACLLLGSALFYSQLGTLALTEIRDTLAAQPPSPFVTVACVLLLLGIAERLGAFPFLSWPADVTEGSPWGGVFLETAGRFISICALLPLFLEALLPLRSAWVGPLFVIGGVTLAWGALGAITQTNLKRLLAYLGQAHVGWLLLFAAASSERGSLAGHFLPSALIFALVALGLRAGVCLLEREANDCDIYQLSGLGETHPVLALWWTLLCLAGAGFPPTSGFAAQTAFFLELGSTGHVLRLIAIGVGLLAVAYSYLRMVAYLYGRECRETIALTHRAALPIACASACAILAVVLLFFWR